MLTAQRLALLGSVFAQSCESTTRSGQVDRVRLSYSNPPYEGGVVVDLIAVTQLILA
jgi:hypothetical protein